MSTRRTERPSREIEVGQEGCVLGMVHGGGCFWAVLASWGCWHREPCREEVPPLATLRWAGLSLFWLAG